MTMTRNSGTETLSRRPSRTAYPTERKEVSVSRDFSTASRSSVAVPTHHKGLRTLPKRRVQQQPLKRSFGNKTGSKQVVSVRGRRVVAPKVNPRIIRMVTVVVLMLCGGVAISMGLSGMSTEQTFALQKLKAKDVTLNNRIESLTRDVEDARSSSTIADKAAKLGMVVPVQPGVLAVQENRDIIEERPADPETRSIINVNDRQVRPPQTTSNPSETKKVTDNLRPVPEQRTIPPYQVGRGAAAALPGLPGQNANRPVGGGGQ